VYRARCLSTNPITESESGQQRGNGCAWTATGIKAIWLANEIQKIQFSARPLRLLAHLILRNQLLKGRERVRLPRLPRFHATKIFGRPAESQLRLKVRGSVWFRFHDLEI
jgi:hypothetical protein